MNYYSNSTANYSLRHLWSLSVEEQFYLLWPVTLALLTPARAGRVLVGVILAVPVLRVVLYTAWPAYELLADTGFEGVCDALATGCLLAVGMRRLLYTSSVLEAARQPGVPVAVRGDLDCERAA